MLERTKNFMTLFVLLPFFLIVGFSFSYSLGMEMKSDGTIGGCIFARQAEICLMTFREHISQWRGVVSAIPQKSTMLVQLFVLASAFTLSILGARRYLLFLLFGYFRERWRLYIKNNPHLPLFDLLQEVFSQGVLNPKIYNGAVL